MRRRDDGAPPLRAFYARGDDEANRLIEAAEITGVDEELALLRDKLREIKQRYPEEFALLLKFVETIVKTVAAQHSLSAKDQRNMEENVLALMRGLTNESVPPAYLDV